MLYEITLDFTLAAII